MLKRLIKSCKERPVSWNNKENYSNFDLMKVSFNFMWIEFHNLLKINTVHRVIFNILTLNFVWFSKDRGVMLSLKI